MKCKLCGKRLTLKEYGKHICRECIEKLPKCLKEDIQSIDTPEAKQLTAKFHSVNDFVDPDQYQSWFSCGDIGITTTGIVIEKKHIVLFKDIKNFFFDYIPRRRSDSDNICFGEFSFHFEIKGFPYEIRTLALRCGTSYRIEKDKFCPDFPEQMIMLSNYILKGVLSKFHCLKDEKAKYEKDYSDGYYTWRRNDRFREKTKKQNRSTGDENRTESRKSTENHTENKKHENTKKNSGDFKNRHANAYSGANDLTGALKFFNLSIPYTQQELKSVYRNMIRQCHPDQQMKISDLKPEDVNRCYGILKKYAS